MAREKFIEKSFSPENLKKLVLLNNIINEYRRQGFVLSVRQLYYQMVARGFIENTQRSYKSIAELINNARLAGVIDWAMIEDRNRDTILPSAWNSPADIIDAAAYSFRIDPWLEQDNLIWVMVEKAALEGILLPICQEERVRFTANRGYGSASLFYETGKLIRKFALDKDKAIHVLYLGDHDPSGIDMTRDVRERLELFSGVEFHVNRLALNFNQVEEWQPPENPAKQTDSRYEAYVDQFGESSWELDAVDPTTLADLVRNYIHQHRDPDLWDEAMEREAEMRSALKGYASQYRKDHSDE